MPPSDAGQHSERGDAERERTEREGEGERESTGRGRERAQGEEEHREREEEGEEKLPGGVDATLVQQRAGGTQSATVVRHPLRDLTTFTDTRMIKKLTKISMAYLALGTAYFGWFFTGYACGGPELPCDWEISARLTRPSTPAEGVNATSSGAARPYPNSDGAGAMAPLLDAVVFILSIFTTVGWGHQPIDLTQRYESGDDRDHHALFDSTKILLCLLAFVGVATIGLLVGTLGATFRAMCRKQVHDRVARMVHKQQELLKKQVKKQLKKGKVPVAVEDTGGAVRHHSSLLEDHDHAIAVLLLVGCIMLGTVAYTYTEKECVSASVATEVCLENVEGEPDGWRYLDFVDAMYMTVVSVSTVGFGDYAPSTTASKLFTVIYLPLAVAFTLNAIDHVSSYLISHRTKKLEQFVLGQYGGTKVHKSRGPGNRDTPTLTAYDFEDLQRSVELDHSQPMSRNDFRLAVSPRTSDGLATVYLGVEKYARAEALLNVSTFVRLQMLLRLARVEPGDFQNIDEVFTLLDPNGSGAIEPPWTEPELSGWVQKKKRRGTSERLAMPRANYQRSLCWLAHAGRPRGGVLSQVRLSNGVGSCYGVPTCHTTSTTLPMEHR